MSPTNWYEWQFREFLREKYGMKNPTDELALRGASFGDYVKFLELISTRELDIPENVEKPEIVQSLVDEGVIDEWLSQAFGDPSQDAYKLITDVALGKEPDKQSIHCDMALAMWLRRLGVYTGNQLLTFLPETEKGRPAVLYSGGFMTQLADRLSRTSSLWSGFSFMDGLVDTRESSTFENLVNKRIDVRGSEVFGEGLANIGLAKAPTYEYWDRAGFNPAIAVK